MRRRAGPELTSPQKTLALINFSSAGRQTSQMRNFRRHVSAFAFFEVDRSDRDVRVNFCAG
jgi:hypothetical protein